MTIRHPTGSQRSVATTHARTETSSRTGAAAQTRQASRSAAADDGFEMTPEQIRGEMVKKYNQFVDGDGWAKTSDGKPAFGNMSKGALDSVRRWAKDELSKVLAKDPNITPEKLDAFMKKMLVGDAENAPRIANKAALRRNIFRAFMEMFQRMPRSW